MARKFLVAAGWLLIAVGSAKLVSAAGSAAILNTYDPVFGTTFRTLFLFVGAGELAVGIFCVRNRAYRSAAWLVFWFAVSFVVYRTSLWWLGYHQPCPCLGTLTAMIGMAPEHADIILKAILGFLFVGSAWILARDRSPQSPATPSPAE